MTIFKILQRLYMEHFHWALSDDFDLEKTFNGLHDFHIKSVPDSESVYEQYYAKFFKNKAFVLLAPIIYLVLKYQFTKYANPEYLERLVEKSLGSED